MCVSDDVNEALCQFMPVLNYCINVNCPVKIGKRKENRIDKGWSSRDIVENGRDLRRLFAMARNTNDAVLSQN